jgi:hypothetical protein
MRETFIREIHSFFPFILFKSAGEKSHPSPNFYQQMASHIVSHRKRFFPFASISYHIGFFLKNPMRCIDNRHPEISCKSN